MMAGIDTCPDCRSATDVTTDEFRLYVECRVCGFRYEGVVVPDGGDALVDQMYEEKEHVDG